ncbi:MAG: cupin domain-containing protein [Pseudomonadota bacterium]
MAENRLVWDADAIAETRFRFRHPLDQNADVTMFPMAHAAGLSTTSVSLVHMEPGHTSFPKHRHHSESEWLYVISGTGTLSMDDETYDLHPGSFAAFPAGGPAHKFVNSGNERLVYLMGGDRKSIEIVDFTEADQRMTRIGGGTDMIADMAPINQFAPFDFMARVDEDD